MTPAELLALAQQLLYDCCDPVTGESLYPGQSSYACVEDVEAAALYLRACAEAEPVATVRVHDTGGNAGIAWTGVPTENHKQRGRMTAPTLIEAARAALDALSCDEESQDDPGHRCSHCDDYVDRNGPVRKALRAAIEAAEKAEPVAYRVETRWRDRALDQSWRKYADTAYRDRAISWRDSANNMETEARIVPLYAGEPEEPR